MTITTMHKLIGIVASTLSIGAIVISLVLFIGSKASGTELEKVKIDNAVLRQSLHDVINRLDQIDSHLDRIEGYVLGR